MALRTSIMSMPYSNESLETEPERYNLLRKLAILLLLVISSALWIYILFREKRLSYPTPVQEIAAGVVIAIVAGLSAQLILSQRGGFLRFVAAMTGDVVGIYLLGFISDGKYGISKFGWLPRAVDYDGLNLIGIGFVIILFMALLFRRTKIIVIPEPIQVIQPDGESSIASVQYEPINSISVSTPDRPRVSLPRVSWSGLLSPSSAPRVRSNGRRPGLIQPAKVAPAVAPKRRRRKKSRVQLALVEEHRCPYCLENVTRADPRGVVECNVCHTLHHKDCWDITGNCQVPHLNT
jgi:ribosomal protein L37AE/L43A